MTTSTKASDRFVVLASVANTPVAPPSGQTAGPLYGLCVHRGTVTRNPSKLKSNRKRQNPEARKGEQSGSNTLPFGEKLKNIAFERKKGSCCILFFAYKAFLQITA